MFVNSVFIGGPSRFHVQTGTFDLPLGVDLGKGCGNELVEEGLEREDCGDVSASLDFILESIVTGGRAEAAPMAARDTEDQQGLPTVRCARPRKGPHRIPRRNAGLAGCA